MPPTSLCQDPTPAPSTYRTPNWAEDYLLAPPMGSTRRAEPKAREDRNRLELHAVLTACAVPPRAGDLHALRQLSTLDQGTVDTVIAWMRSAHGDAC
ncbi:hypothetical protein [Streptomyces sp. NPDC005438]|uniref:hypothetical protein n=1 Tax=Streptomyces sp. NPDC005438 TaxID=3156880 RepID=UPI00339F71D7